METKLGKIDRAEFGYCGYQDACLGLSLTFSMKSGGVNWSINGGFAPSIVEHTEYCKWTEEERNQNLAMAMRNIDNLLHTAKVDKVSDLAGTPVEITFDGNLMKSFRVLEEVL